MGVCKELFYTHSPPSAGVCNPSFRGRNGEMFNGSAALSSQGLNIHAFVSKCQ